MLARNGGAGAIKMPGHAQGNDRKMTPGSNWTVNEILPMLATLRLPWTLAETCMTGAAFVRRIPRSKTRCWAMHNCALYCAVLQEVAHEVERSEF